jgi:hypothetical protein
MATAEQIAVANKTSRNSSAIGAKAITPKFVRKLIDDNDIKATATILDFGAGKTANHARAMVEDGYLCLAHEFGDNVDPRYHCELAMSNTYDVVYASNVLNVQSSLHMFIETIEQVKSVMKDDGVFVANFPLEPRKMNMKAWQMRELLQQHFSSAIWAGGKKGAPIFLMVK